MLQLVYGLLIASLILSSVVPGFSVLPVSGEAIDEAIGRSSATTAPQNGDQARQKLVQTLESSLLKMLGLKSRPKDRSKKVQIPEYILKLYNKQKIKTLFSTNFNMKNKLTRSANIIRHHYHDDGKVDEKYDNRRFMFKFNISNIPLEESMKASELSMHFRPSRSRSKVVVEIYDVVRPPTVKSEPILTLVDSRTILTSKTSSWQTFDVLPAVLRNRERQTLGNIVRLYVKVSSTNMSVSDVPTVRLKREALEDRDLWTAQKPYLLTYTDDGKYGQSLSRMKRENRKNRRVGKKDICRRHPLYVDFSDVGWNDWIVAPPGYQAYYCQGDCPFPLADHTNSTNHAIVQTLMNSVNPGAVPMACCVPTELSPISMLYLDEYDKVVLKNYQDMVVEGCGCR